MNRLHEDGKLRDMRQRLYDRGAEVEKIVRHELSDEKEEVSDDWGVESTLTSRDKATDFRAGSSFKVAEPVADSVVTEDDTVLPPKPKRRYRSFVLFGSMLIFVFVAVVASIYLYFGGNQISNQNIMLSLEGQPLIGGGEVMSLAVTVTNNNSVSIDAATLILKYPSGTRSVGENPRNLYEDRIPLNNIAPGDTQNVPVRVAVFGDENDEKQIEATIEYRISGSNGMFYKDATPYPFRISSSPLVLRIDSVTEVAAGQLVEVQLTAESNASSPLEDLLVTAIYPTGFEYERSEPAPIYGENVWRIDSLENEESTTITIRGYVTGHKDESFRINFEAGPADPDNQYLVGATLADAKHDFVLEEPFLDVELSIEGDSDNTVILPEGEESSVVVKVTNTLDEVVYDMVVEVIPEGSALQLDSIQSINGFYDSNKGVVRFDVANEQWFDEVLPGDTRTLKFIVNPTAPRSTAAFDLVVNVYARRVADSNALETLVGTVRSEAKYSSNIAFGAQVDHDGGPLQNSGTIPPRVGEPTTYTVTLVAEAGVNELTNAEVEVALPTYVEWTDVYEVESGTVSYNAVSKRVTWNIGTMSVQERRQLDLQVSLTPSISQAGRTPTLVQQMIFRATDRFTGERLQETTAPVTTELSSELGYERENGRVAN